MLSLAMRLALANGMLEGVLQAEAQSVLMGLACPLAFCSEKNMVQER